MPLTVQRDTLERCVGWSMTHDVLALSSTTFFKGQMVAISAAGLLIPAVNSVAANTTIGRCEENIVTGAGNTRKVKVRCSVFKWANKGGDLVTQALLYKDCFVEDDFTVKATVGTSATAGRVMEIEADGVWVSQPFPLPIT